MLKFQIFIQYLSTKKLKEKSDSHFMSFLLFHTKTGTVYYDLTEISEKYMYNIELFRTYTF